MRCLYRTVHFSYSLFLWLHHFVITKSHFFLILRWDPSHYSTSACAKAHDISNDTSDQKKLFCIRARFSHTWLALSQVPCVSVPTCRQSSSCQLQTLPYTSVVGISACPSVFARLPLAAVDSVAAADVAVTAGVAVAAADAVFEVLVVAAVSVRWWDR